MITTMLIIWVNIVVVLFLSYVYFQLSAVENHTISNHLYKWLMIISAAGVVTKLGKSLLAIICIVIVGWLVLQKAKNQQKKNVRLGN